MRALYGHCRAEAIDDAKVFQKPLFPGFRVPFELLKLRVEIGVCGDGKIRQWKRKPFARSLQEGFLSRPAGKKALHTEMIRQRLKSGPFAKREEALGKRCHVDVGADFLDVDA